MSEEIEVVQKKLAAMAVSLGTVIAAQRIAAEASSVEVIRAVLKEFEDELRIAAWGISQKYFDNKTPPGNWKFQVMTNDRVEEVGLFDRPCPTRQNSKESKPSRTKKRRPSKSMKQR